ncbi:LPXTG cell wall anchor domain-containing protein [Candidatus Atribacteria bacterium 1244-E10-H5-B2]|nr:MAG: LPXTG cell wall anchor domain-containing protein [Candidatus Atribacteria bacterium 1244-E10-H5-B2]
MDWYLIFIILAIVAGIIYFSIKKKRKMNK